MKKLMIVAVMAASLSAFADDSAACKDYLAQVEASLKKDGNYSEEAMKITRDQIAAVGGDQQEAFCKAAIDAMKAAESDSGSTDDAEEEGEGEEESKG